MAEDRAASQEMTRLSGSTAVPQTYIDGEMVVGYNENLLREKLGIKAPTTSVTKPPAPPASPGVPLPVTPASPASTTLEKAAPLLISPSAGAVMDNGRTDRADSIVWDFDWSDVPGATQYQLYVIGRTAAIPVINATTNVSSYRSISEGSYIGGGNLFGWTWKVRALFGSEWSTWSDVRSFDVEPVNTDLPGPRP